MRASQQTQRARERAIATQFHKSLACQGQFLKPERINREGSIKPESELLPAWQVADISEVPVDGKDLLEYARRDKVFSQVRLVARAGSQDADMMAGAYQLLLIYRKFVMERRSRCKHPERRYQWTWDMNSKAFLLGAHRCAVELRIAERKQQEYGKDKWQVKLPRVTDYPPEILYGGIPPVSTAAAC